MPTRGLMVRAWTRPRGGGRILFEAPYGNVERDREELEGPKFELPMLRWVAVDRGRGGPHSLLAPPPRGSIQGRRVGPGAGQEALLCRPLARATLLEEP